MDIEVAQLVHEARQSNSLKVKEQLAFLEEKGDDYTSSPHIRELEDEHGWTLLHLACALKDVLLVENLLKLSDVNVNCRSKKFKQTPLHIASSVGCSKIVQLLIKSQARLDQADAAGYTALHYAAYEGYRGTVETILNALISKDKANIVELLDEEGNSALDLAKRVPNGKIVEIIQSFLNSQLPHHMVSNEEREQVVTWLRDTVGLPQYTDAFINNGYTRLGYWAKRGISKEEFIEIGVLLSGHQRMIDSYLREFGAKANNMQETENNSDSDDSEASGSDSGDSD